MTHGFSRRTLAKGVAWAAPVVVASASVPVYAASSPCPADIDAQVEAVFQRRLAALPNLQNTTIRFWYNNNASSNGALGTSNLRVQVTNGGVLDVPQLPFGFEFAQRNVATSPAINKLFGGGKIRSAQMPAEWPANNKWNTSTGVADDSPAAVNVDDPMPLPTSTSTLLTAATTTWVLASSVKRPVLPRVTISSGSSPSSPTLQPPRATLLTSLTPTGVMVPLLALAQSTLPLVFAPLASCPPASMRSVLPLAPLLTRPAC